MTAWVDVEGSLRAWEKARLTTVGGRVFFGYPDSAPVHPLVTLSMIGGSPQRGEAPLSDIRLSHQIWATNKHQAVDVVKELVGVLVGLASEPLDAETYVYSVEVVNVLWLPDQASKLARYVVDAVLTLRAI